MTQIPKEAQTGAVMTESPWLTRTEAAAYLRISPLTFDRWLRERRVKRYKVAGQQSIRFLRSDLDALMTPVEEDEPS